MFAKSPDSLRLTLRALACLLSYPDAELRAVLPQLLDALQVERALSTPRQAEMEALCRHLTDLPPLEAQELYW